MLAERLATLALHQMSNFSPFSLGSIALSFGKLGPSDPYISYLTYDTSHLISPTTQLYVYIYMDLIYLDIHGWWSGCVFQVIMILSFF